MRIRSRSFVLLLTVFSAVGVIFHLNARPSLSGAQLPEPVSVTDTMGNVATLGDWRYTAKGGGGGGGKGGGGGDGGGGGGGGGKQPKSPK